MSQTFAPPTGPPPTSAPALPRRNSNDLDIPDEAPPAYTPSAAQAGSTTVDAGPSRMDFSGPPPIPERLTNNITGVGVGYGPRVSGVSPQPTGASSSSGTASSNPFGDHNRPPQHPSKTDSSSSFAPPPHPPPSRPHHTSQSSYGGGNATGSSSQPSVDTSPTDVPTPGRPLLRKGQMLVYPKNHFCSKCNNTGYKANDPSNPHDADWRKYGKPFTAALAASYKSSSGPNANPAATSASNFQRPLPALNNQHNPPPQHHPPPSSQWNTYPGQGARPPPPPPPPQQMQHMPMYHAQPQYAPPQQIIHGGRFGMPPPGALVLQAGDPRIGGRLCHNCGGHGREISFFGFDDGKCWTCGGLGRVF